VTSEGQSPARERDDAAARAAERPGFDTSVAHQARMYDYWLGGKDNFAADRKAAQESLAAFPGMAHLARANRAFLGRVIRYLAGEAGIRQFLDVGTGIPTASNTHQVAQEVAPECRVVYVDYDPVVLSHARALLTSTPEGATDYIDADLREPGDILAKAARTLDFAEPVAVTMRTRTGLWLRSWRRCHPEVTWPFPIYHRTSSPSWPSRGTALTASATSSTPTAVTPRSCASSTAWTWLSPGWWSCGSGGPRSKAPA